MVVGCLYKVDCTKITVISYVNYKKDWDIELLIIFEGWNKRLLEILLQTFKDILWFSKITIYKIILKFDICS